ncbi:MAG: hypothetical protein P8K14_00645 [Flavobacteriaceae bacterium]|jgi:hypothetical protein|nr:hypothetical protein [Flavobacteriaceae bacterium]
MKNIILLLISVSLMTSCIETTKSNNKIIEKQSIIGYDISDEGEKRDLEAGSIENITLWDNYIKAHNDRDFDVIRSLDSDTFKARGPQGQFIEGIDAHIEFLSQWFDQNSPKWKIKYAIANDVRTKDGELRQWVTAGHDVTLTVDGKEVNLYQVIDALISDGKVQEFYVHERVKGENE